MNAHPRSPAGPAAPPPRRLRRVALLSLPPLALLLLGWLGRFALEAPLAAAAAASAASATSATTSALAAEAGVDAAVPQDGAAFAAEASASAAPDGGVEAGRALETLADGAVIVDLNLANESDLRALPGVGPSRAKAIVALRQRLGRLRTVDDLARIKGFGRALVRRLRPLVKV